MRFLNEKSDFKSKVLIKDALHEDYWYKIKTGDGHVGWAIGVGLVFENEEPSKIAKDSLRVASGSTFDIAKKYLKGNALYYVLANDLYWRSRAISVAELEQEVEAFTMINPVGTYDRILQNTLEEVRHDTLPDIVYGSYIYRIMESPNIGRDASPKEVVSSVVILEDEDSDNTLNQPKTSLTKLDTSLTAFNKLYALIDLADSSRIIESVSINNEGTATAKVNSKPQTVQQFIDIPGPKGERAKSPLSIGVIAECFRKLILFGVAFIEAPPFMTLPV